MSKRTLLLPTLLVAIALTVVVTYFQIVSPEKVSSVQPEPDSIQVAMATYEPTYKYGFVVDSLQVLEGSVKRNESLSDILLSYNVSHQDIFKLANKAKEIFDVRKIRANKKYTVIQANDSLARVKALVYEPGPAEYVVFDLQDSMKVFVEKRPVEIVEKTVTGIIHDNLYVDMLKNGGSPELVDLVADMYGWQIDFTKIYDGDKFKVLFTERVINGESVGIEEIIGAELVHYDNPFLAVAFDQGEGLDYFDESGKSLRKAFLRYPVKYTRISSRYTKRRYHPVQKRYKAHLGTDYAAPTGTPIYAAGDGIVTKARYEKYNGRNVKIRHNGTYSTQYLHMSSLAVKPGQKVKQGQLIGKVGSTGLATGPHLCYRFWKNGRQVDALSVDLPAAEPIFEEQLSTYMRYKDYVRKQLDAIEYPKEDPQVLMAKVK